MVDYCLKAAVMFDIETNQWQVGHFNLKSLASACPKK